ncbi:indolepyruvate ferredoxin oxidoreductase family protein [Qingshengfaniella alkalisoli]|uniref:Indolepyruvate ferredoxin oxidoreductase family protein n=1 Tax=Qingshengfaniella alkalisoli TaxID=2599296 RepID=A0A5B8IAX1_9RHOB|nr:indolepyruvate ferredoxin oxidoreductase family protein [Qingshengfaniella alkalisoli]QDY71229.1 indolepyruvate ferredoxin oxidoreductase family protein [Qingshengfaniella alkalisoli]
MNAPVSFPEIALDDKYTATSGRIFLTGIQALVRLPMTQMRLDHAAGLNTAAYVCGYRGSPLGGYDLQLMAAKAHLDRHDVTFQPGVNEDLAATAIWGTQQVGLSKRATKDGVLGVWYGKGPGVDRSGDVFKHGNAAGSARHGGVLAIAGDDHTAKSSSIPHQSDHAFISALMPMLYPSSVQEFLEMGLLGIAMSRYSGCWVGFKVIADTVETATSIDLMQEERRFVLPTDFEMPEGGLNLRWPDPPLVQDDRLQEYKGYAAIAFARANKVDEITIDTPNARFGIVASGKAFEDVRQALYNLGIGKAEIEAIGLRLYKVRMPWPLEPEGIRHFSEGLDEILIVEERREIIENQIKQQLFNWRADVRPRIVGKMDDRDRHVLPLSQGFTVGRIARAIADRLLHLNLPEGLHDRIAERLHYFERRHEIGAKHEAPVIRLPHYCAGCPHNTSTRVPEGSNAMAGIGCHYMVQWMDRNTETITHMGGEGVPWAAISRYTDEKHRFVNLGDGTYFHSGHLAVRQSVSAGANITYKILYNDAVAMTGGQHVDGELSPAQITHQMYHERVSKIWLVSDAPEAYRKVDLAPGVIIRHRDDMDAVMLEAREVEGVSVIVYEQTCAAELRRRRKRGKAPDPAKRVFIHPGICEGCGDCADQSNCIAVEPRETAFGRKREINQSTCNKDFSCMRGFCPSFVTVDGGDMRKPEKIDSPDDSQLPSPTQPSLDAAWNIAVTGVGGTGILTIGAILGMAAHIEGKTPLVLDMAGLAQKGGAVLSHIRISRSDGRVTAPRIVNGGADLLLAADSVVAASRDGYSLCDPDRTYGVINTKLTPVSDFIRHRDFDFKTRSVDRVVRGAVRPDAHFHDFSELAVGLMGDEIFANVMMLGYAVQAGLVPVGLKAIEQAIRLNGVAVQANQDALIWGRLLMIDPAMVHARARPKRRETSLAEMSLEEITAHRADHLTDYQNAGLAKRYTDMLARLESAGIGPKTRRVVAIQYAKLLAYKDEYEVARLFCQAEWREEIERTMTGEFKLSFNLAPPILHGSDASGRPKKRRMGGWMFPILSRLRFLRGTLFDPFGYLAERRQERRLIAIYEEDLAKALAAGSRSDDAPLAVALSWPDQIRGYGPVKAKAIERALAMRDKSSEIEQAA